MKLEECLEVIYYNTDKGREVVIPEEFLEEYKEYASSRVSQMGNSARASNKRSFVRNNVERIYPDHFLFLKSYLTSSYEEGCGLKTIAKKIGLTPTMVRTLFGILKIEINKGQNVVYQKTREIRSNNLKKAYKKRSGWFKTFERRTNKTSRGVQGYYYNKSKKKHVWLRSTYEFVYAKWLDKHSIEWDVEQKTFQLEKSTYRPDFFIYEKGRLVKIVEIKGYWARGEVKTKELSEKLQIDVVLIKDIDPYLENSYPQELKKWKQELITEQKLKKLQ